MNSFSKNQNKSSNIAGFTLTACLIITTTKLFKSWTNTDFVESADNNRLAVALSGLIFLVIIPQLIRKREKVYKILKTSWPLVLLYLFAMTSCFWAPFPFIALNGFIRQTLIVLCILNVITEEEWKKSLVSAIFHYLTITIFLSLVFIFILPQYGWHRYNGGYMPNGFFTHKNTLGALSAFSIFYCVLIYRKKGSKKEKTGLCLLILLSSFLLLFSRAFTSIGGFLLSIFTGMIYYFFKHRDNSYYQLSLICTLLSLTLLFVFFRENQILLDPLKGFVELSGKELTFTGRTDLWAALLYIGNQVNPYFGSGYNSFFLGDKSSWLLSYISWDAPDAHNGFISIFLELGFIGLFILTFFLLYVLLEIHRNKKFTIGNKAKIIGLFSFVIFFNIFEAGMLNDSLAYIALLILFFSFVSSRNKNDTINPSHKGDK